MTKPATPLCCPKCGSQSLRSDEKAAIGYNVLISRNGSGQIDVNYTGDREVWDEGTVYEGDLWCRDCGAQLAEADLVTEDDLDDDPDKED